MSKYDIGIDPGKHTGLTVYDPSNKNIISIDTMLIHSAIEFVYRLHNENMVRMVYLEDARKRGHGGPKGDPKRQGAGSIKRDCTIWEDFLKDNDIKFTLVAPQSNTTKLDAKRFMSLTGWQQRTNEHGRDSAMLVWGRQ